MTTGELVNQIKATYNVLSDEAMSFVGGAPGNLHLAVLAVITGQLQVPGWVGHCGTPGHTSVNGNDQMGPNRFLMRNNNQVSIFDNMQHYLPSE